MKRQLLLLVVAGGLALMAAPNASAGSPAPGFCGNNYAMLMTGDEGNLNPALGSSAGFPGALTAIVGVGVIQFSRNCSSISGELIYNDGDIQFTGNGNTAGVSAGPAKCFPGLLGGVPCFDGGNHFTSGSVTTAGEPTGLALLQFTANFNFFDYGLEASSTGSLPFAFNIQETSGDSTLVGVTVPSPTAPVLTLTMQLQPSLRPFGGLPTTFGLAPYSGSSAIICTGYGADNDDIIAEIANAESGGVSGSYGTAVGSVSIPLNGQAHGILSFNGNDNLQVFGSTAAPSNNSACEFSEVLDPFDGPAAFADGTSNLWSTITSPSTDATCTNAKSAGGGFTTSEVAWGAGDLNSYATVTGLTETTFPFIPPGEMSTCTHLSETPQPSGFPGIP